MHSCSVVCGLNAMHDNIAESFHQVFKRLRISVSHACQLRCVFCHREGIAAHWQPRFLDLRSFEHLMDGYRAIGGREVNLTGGEPTLHPSLGQLLEVAGSNRLWRLTLHTNGLAIDRVLPELRAGLVDEVRVSLHCADDGWGRRFLGRGWSFARVADSIAAVRESGAPVTVVFTYSVDTAKFLRDVVRFADSARVSLLVLDLISTRWMRVHEHARGAGTDDILEAMRPFANIEGWEWEGGGCRLRSLKSRHGNEWWIKDTSFGRQFTEACRKCEIRQECGEGVYALRVDATGFFRPCLLRRDLERSLPMPFASTEVVIDMFELMYKLMTQAQPPTASRWASGLIKLESVKQMQPGSGGYNTSR